MPTLGDVRHALRAVRQQPGTSTLAVLALALGIGLTTTMFSIVNGAVIRGLPFPQSDRLLHLAHLRPSVSDDDFGVSIADYTDWRAQQDAFEDLAAFYTDTINLSASGERPERYRGAWVTPNTFGQLRVRPPLGRDFEEADGRPGAPLAAIVSDAVWRDRYRRDPAVIGRAVRLNGRPATIVGVMPPRFAFPVLQDVWIGAQLDPLAAPRGEGPLEVIGRLKPGVRPRQATAAMAAIARRLELEYPASNDGITVEAKTYVREFLGDETIGMLYTMLGAVFGVLLIACANVANLLLARAASRARDVAIRSALGARRSRVIGLFLMEVLALTALGAGGGLVLARLGVALFNRAIVDTRPPFWIDIRIDGTVLLFVLALTMISALTAGLLPAVRASREDVSGVLKDQTRGATGLRVGRLSRGLVVGEMALSFGLLVAAGLMIRTVVNVGQIQPIFHADDVLLARASLPETDYPDDPALRRFAHALIGRLEREPAARAAALATALPGEGPGRQFGIEGVAYTRPDDHPRASVNSVTPAFFDVFGLPVLQGRALAASDDENGRPVVVVDTAFAGRHFAGAAPIGRRLRFGTGDAAEPWRTIVGVVPDARLPEPGGPGPESVYVPMDQAPGRSLAIVMRTSGSPTGLTSQVRDTVAAIDRDLPIFGADSVAGLIQAGTWPFRVFGTLFMAFGFAALLMASIGLYGVMAFAVRHRVQEIGVRMAMGARARDVVSLILRQGLWQVALGIVLGVGLAGWLASAMTLLLVGVTPWDPALFVFVALTLGATALAACLVPARRAAHVDPMVALRSE